MRPPGRTTTARLLAGYVAIVFMLPYLTLKLAWLSGDPIGFNDPALVKQPGMIAANALSFGMDLVAVGLALTFAHGWGMRVPAWLVLFPMWVASGFLVPAVLVVPLGIISRAWAARPAPATDAMLQPWVGRLVTFSFAGQGAALVVAFLLYVRTRWAGLQSAAAARVADSGRGTGVWLANAAALMAAAAGILHLVWACGGSAGLGPPALSQRTLQSYLLHAIWGVLCLAGAGGILAMVHQWFRRVPFKLVLALIWIGAGSMFAWGLWTLVPALSGFTFGRGVPDRAALGVSLVKFAAGLLIAVVTALRLRGRRVT